MFYVNCNVFGNLDNAWLEALSRESGLQGSPFLLPDAAGPTRRPGSGLSCSCPGCEVGPPCRLSNSVAQS